ncbi:MAG: tetratricopeptide repeat protein [Polyangiaceae bacterium]|nr:tetratricopeptide repeat protein [Polyangiaceae bacterium]
MAAPGWRSILLVTAVVSASPWAHADPPGPERSPPTDAAPEPSPTPDRAAADVRTAVRSRDSAALARLAARALPDPWLVADALLETGDRDVAEAFAAAAPRDASRALFEHVKRWRSSSADRPAREAIAAAIESLRTGAPQSALAAVESCGTPGLDAIVGARLASVRAQALRRVGPPDRAVAAGIEAGEAARRLGWLAQAARELASTGRYALMHDDVDGARRAISAWVAVEEVRGAPAEASDALRELGIALEAAGQADGALDAYSRALERAETAEDARRTANAATSLAGYYDAHGARPEARELYLRALALQVSVDDRRARAATLGNLGGLEALMGRPGDAREHLEEALALARALGADDVAATTLSNLGLVHRNLGELAEAKVRYEAAAAAQDALGDRAGAAHTRESLAVVERMLGSWTRALELHDLARAEGEALGDRALVARSLAGSGLVQLELGNYPKALELTERALREDEARGDRAGAATTLCTLGVVQWSLGNWAKALELYERALAEQEAVGDRAGAATTLCNLGVVLQHVGDREQAIETYDRALRVQESIGDRVGAATTLGNLGVVHWSLGRWSKALEIYERVLAEQDALGERAGAVTTLGNVALVHQHLGRHEQAAATYRRALAQAEALHDRVRSVALQLGLAESQRALGDVAAAEATLDQAVHLAERLRTNDRLLRALGALARSKLARGDAAGALADAHRAVSLIETMLGGLGEEQGVLAREQFASLFAIGADAALQAGDAREAAYFLESGRAGTLLEALGGRESMRWAGLPDGLRVALASAKSKEVAALRVYHRALDEKVLAPIQAASKDLDEARGEVRSVVERIQRGSKRAANVWYPRAAALDEIRGWLAPGDVLVVYGIGGRSAFALRLSSERADLVPLGDASVVRDACDALHVTDVDTDPSAALSRLRALVVAPLGLERGGVRRVLVAPEGPLCYVPFAALLTDVALVTVPSATTYGLLLEEEGRQRGRGVLALGDPDYGARRDVHASAVYAQGARLTALPRTREEAREVGETVLLGADATEPGLRAALGGRPRWRAVHLACHGIVDPERPTLSALALTPSAGDDGFLTALEVLDYRAAADLVVLSACETGRGRIVAGEGIVGLTRSFMYAGAARVVCSLWRVDDDATRALMTSFYGFWNPKDGTPGLPTAEALRRAQQHVRAQPRWRHPYYWAAWVLWGLPS